MDHDACEGVIEKWLVEKGYACFNNASIGGKFPDIVALKDGKLIAVEVKNNALEIPVALGQCLFYLVEANEAYIAIPYQEHALISDGTLEVLKSNSIGLLGCSKSDVKIILKGDFKRKNNSAFIDSLRNRTQKNRTKIKNSQEFMKKIKRALLKQPMTVEEISRCFNINRATASKYLAVMEMGGLIKCRMIGNAKLFSVVKK
ncbi:MAG: winged helix-turn-helix transcriptional regulator [Candidatus Aenigmarchaeota archaeon]|nr:winged helix-turn-helix transcriptional regulator [Candidatus Aenigmarchaeota archaeon]